MYLLFLCYCTSGRQGQVVDFSGRPHQAKQLIKKGFAVECDEDGNRLDVEEETDQETQDDQKETQDNAPQETGDQNKPEETGEDAAEETQEDEPKEKGGIISNMFKGKDKDK